MVYALDVDINRGSEKVSVILYADNLALMVENETGSSIDSRYCSRLVYTEHDKHLSRQIKCHPFSTSVHKMFTHCIFDLW